MLRIRTNGIGLNLVTLIFVFAFFKVFLGSVTPSGVTSAIQIVMCGGVLLWLAYRAIGGLLNINLLPILTLVLYLGLSLSWSLDPVYGLVKYQAWVINSILPALAIYGLLTRTTQRINWGLFIASCTVFAVVTLVFGSGARNSLDSLNVIWTSRIVIAGLTVTLFTRMPWPVKVALASLFLVVAFRAESRGPVVSLALPLAVYLVGWTVQQILRLQYGLNEQRVILAVFALAPLLLASYTAYGYIAELQETRYAKVATDDDGTVSIRTQLIGTALEAFQHSPVSGDGVGGFSRYYPNYYPHNVIAEFACEGGIIALALLAWILVRAVRSAWTLRSAGPIILAVQCFGYALFSGALDGNHEWFLMYSVLTGLTVASVREDRHLNPAYGYA